MTTTLPWRVEPEPFEEHPWVLLTMHSDADDVEVTAHWLAQGYEVYLCEGPQPGHSCPVMSGGGCPVADRAHMVVNGLPVGAGTDALLAALAEHHPDLPVIDVG